MTNKYQKRVTKSFFSNLWQKRKGKVLIISLLILIYLFITAVGGALYFRHQLNAQQQVNQKLQAKMNQQQQANEIEIDALKHTKPIRSFDNAKQITDNALQGLLGAMYNWNGSNFADRYNKALAYIDKDTLIKSFTSNAQIPSKKAQQQTAKAYQHNNAVDKIVTLQNGIQNINGNNVSGFVWCTSEFQEFGKNTQITMQAQYVFDLKKQKFTQFNLEPFSDNIVD